MKFPTSNRLTRSIPPLIFGATALHLVVAVVVGNWADILGAGPWNAVHNDDDSRMSTLWFTLAGIAFLGLGILTRKLISVSGVVPAETGWIMLSLGIPMAVLEPVSGGWLIAGIGVLAVTARQRDMRRANVVA